MRAWMTGLGAAILLSAGTAAAAPAAIAPGVVVELVDGAADSEGAEALAEGVRARLQAELDARVEAREGEPLASPAAGTIAIVISPMPAAPGEDFLVRVLARDGEQRLDGSEPLACVACGEQELAELAIGALDPRLAALAERAPAPPPAPVIDETDLRPSSTPAGGRPRSPGSGRPLVIAGMVTGLVGAGVLGVGAGLLAIGDGYQAEEPGAATAAVTDYRPAGAAMAAVGGAALITGAACFAVGMRRLAARRGLAQTTPIPTPIVAPMLAPGVGRRALGVGLAFEF